MKTRLAITAMSGVFPGTRGPVGVEGFWENIKLARPAMLQSLEQKWGLRREQYFDPRPGTPYRTYLDAAFMISERDASLQVEIGKRVIRDLVDSVSGTELPDAGRIGLSVGTLWSDAGYFAEDAKRVVGTGLDISLAATEAGILGPDGQLAALREAAGIAGPALAIDTACASSLYALDTAIGLIDQERADAVVVMGLNGFLPPFLYLGFSKLMALSPKKEILPFSSEASGIIPSEAIAAVLVEPVEQAMRCGRPVLAVIRGLGLSADGGDCSVFAPSPRGQQLAYERAYRHIDPRTVDYVEAHGTATVLGDTTEIQTLDQFFAPYRRGNPLAIGSVKALIGHSIGSAGISSLIKAICMIRDRVVPPHIPVQPNPKLRDSCLRLPVEAEPWPERRPAQRVAISSFGLGGANSHLVIGSLEDGDLAGGHRRPLQVAIMAVDATMGEAHGSPDVRELFTRAASAGSTAGPFPWQRFSSALAAADHGHAQGRFFPSQLPIDAQGLRMGPKALAKLDPFQRLGIHAIRRTLAAVPRSRDLSSLEETAVVFCSNLGGEGALQLSRHYLAYFSEKPECGDRYAQVEPSMEAIASGLSSLCSGFPAFHLGLKGFHQTVSGDSSTFWQTLMLAPYWLEGKCTSLVIAAGRHVKSPVDLDSAVTPGEGVASFLLQSEEEARHIGLQPIAVIRGVVPCIQDGDAFRPACAAQGLDPSAISMREISQLNQAADLGTAQKICGFLAEATGAEALLRVLLVEGTGWRAIEIRDEHKTVAHVFLEKLREWEPRQESPAMPVPVEFQAPAPERRLALPQKAGISLSTFLAWQDSTETAVSSYLRSQAKLISLGGVRARPALPAGFSRARHLLRRNRRNIVLEPPAFERAENGEAVAAARLHVDEGHAYFFDHPLDHVPGILIMEGMLQLVEMLMPEGNFIRSIDLNFRRFCEKGDPAIIRARRSRGEEIPSYSVSVIQNGFDVSRCEIETAPAPRTLHPASSGFAAMGKQLPDPKYVHKLNRENVLVTQIEEIAAGEVCACDLLPPPPGHILSEGDPQRYSLLYVLEATRQFVMLIAHQVEKIPFGMQMNLVSIRVQLDEPVPRDRPLRFLCSRQPVQRIGQMTIAEIHLGLHAPHGKIGETAIKAQVVDKETYAKQRGLDSVRAGV